MWQTIFLMYIQLIHIEILNNKNFKQLIFLNENLKI